MDDEKFLNFEEPIKELAQKLSALRTAAVDSPALNDEILNLEKENKALTKKIYSKLDTWQIVQVARHPNRPHTSDFIARIFDDFDELHGDRQFGDDASIIGGIGMLENMPVMAIGHEKGRDTDEKVKRNFGMTNPEGYRKAKRLMLLAEQFSLPVITFVDTAGAYPGVEGEERCQSEAIARNLATMSELKTPIIVVVTGEGGSGGALAISVGDHLSMLEYAIYSVASPEACASIIWRSSEKAPDAAEAMKVSSNELKKIKIVDEIIQEPLGGAHTFPQKTISTVKKKIQSHYNELSKLSLEELINKRINKFTEMGKFKNKK